MTTKNQTRDTFMSAITTVEFERPTLPSETYLSELGDDGPPYTISGVALGAGDVTKGKSGIKKKWPAEELKKAAETLQGTSLVVNHENTAQGVVGQVTKAGYKQDTGVIYEAELYEEDLAEKVRDGLLEVSVRGLHADVDSLQEEEETGATVVEDIEFKNLSIVPTGAAPSNTLEMGEHAELSEAELSAFTESLETEELQEIEPGMWVKWGENRGITISQVQDGEIEVDIYEEQDGQWRSTKETEMVSVDDLDEWDVDEDNIGAAPDEEDGEDEEEDSNSEEENAAIQRGEFVKWKDVDNNWRHGQIIEVEQEGGQFVATLRRFTESGDKLDETEQKPVQGLDKWDDAPRPSDDEETESDGVDAPEWSEGQMVQWQVNPDMKGRIVHVDEEKKIIMVEVMEEDGGEMKSSGFTVTAGYSDLEPVEDMEDAATTTKDAPTQDAEPEHDTVDEQPKLGDVTLKELLKRVDELALRTEGEEIVLDSPAATEAMKWTSPERFTRDEIDTDIIDIEDVTVSTADLEENSADEGTNMTEDTDELSDVEELQEYEFHEATWDGTTTSDWSTPNMEDFDTDDLSEIASHFLISSSGFPPENFGDLKLPIVEPNGDLNVNALAAVKGGRGVSAVDGLSSDMEDEIVNYVNNLANEHFDKNWGEEEEMAKHGDVPDAHMFDSKEDAMQKVNELGMDGVHEYEGMWVPGESHEEYLDNVASASSHMDEEDEEMSEHSIEGTSGEPTEPTKTVGGVRVLPGDDLQEELSGESTADSLSQYKVTTNMNEEIEEMLSELDDPVAVEAEELEELQDKADRFEELSENIEALRERTEILDEVEREQVEELAENEDAVVVESAHYEELQSEAEQVKGVYAASLAEHMPGFEAEELADNFSIEELREKHEDVVGDIEEELSADGSEEAEPRSADPSEEELEEASEEEETSEEELEDEAEQKREEIRQKIFSDK